jgi:hypothetical protein
MNYIAPPLKKKSGTSPVFDASSFHSDVVPEDSPVAGLKATISSSVWSEIDSFFQGRVIPNWE